MDTTLDQSREWIAFERLIALLKSNGFTVSVRDYVEFCAVFEQFGHTTAEDLKHYLAPLICRNQDEQQTFYRVFDQWLQLEDKYDSEKLSREKTKRIRVVLIASSVICISLLFFFIARWILPTSVGPFKPEICISSGDVVYTGDTITFSEGCSGKMPTDTSITYRWAFGDGTGLTQTKPAAHVYGVAKNYTVRLQVLKAHHQIASKDTLVKVCQKALSLTINPGTIDSGRQVRIEVPSQLQVVAADSSTWVVGKDKKAMDSIPYTGKPIVYQPRQTGDFEVHLFNRRRFSCPIANGSFTVNSPPQVLYNLNASAQGELAGSSYRVNMLFSVFISLLVTLLVLLLLFFQVKLEPERRTSQPVSISFGTGSEKPTELPFLNKDRAIQPENKLARVLSELQQRVAGDLNILNIPETISRTIKSHGLLSPVYTARKQDYHYVFLIDNNGIYSQQIHLFTFLAGAFIRENIQITAYHFNREPDVFYDLENKYGYSLVELGKLHEQAVLIVISDGYKFISKAFPAIRLDLSTGFSNWDKRILVTPLPAIDWGQDEKLLCRFFRLVPADLEGWIRVIQMITEANSWSVIPADWKNIPVSNIDFENINELEKYLSDGDLFQWVCALSIHHRIRWEVTLAIGQALLEKANALYKLNYTNLLKLARINWIKEGAFPTGIRLDLLKSLSEESELTARKTMLVLLAETDHLVSESSFSYNEKKMQEITDSFIIYSNNATANTALETKATEFLAFWESGSISDVALKNYLKNENAEWETPLRLHGSKLSAGGMDNYIGSLEKRSIKRWKRPGATLGIIVFLLLFPISQLGLITYADDIAHTWFNKIIPVVSVENQALMNITFRLDTGGCFRAVMKNDSDFTVALKAPDSVPTQLVRISPGIAGLRNVSQKDTAKKIVEIEFKDIPVSLDRAAMLTVTIRGNRSKALQTDLSNYYKRFDLSVSGPSCRPAGRLVYIQYDRNTSPVLAEMLRQCIAADGYTAEVIEQKDYNRADVVRYLTRRTKAAADSLAAAASICLKKKIGSVYRPFVSTADSLQNTSGQLEIWLNDDQNCRIVTFDSIPGLVPGNQYYNAGMSKGLALYKDSVVLKSGNKSTSSILPRRVNNCSGIYTLYFVNNYNVRITDSVQFDLPKNGRVLSVISAPKNYKGNFNLLFNTSNYTTPKTLTDSRLIGSWQTANLQKFTISETGFGFSNTAESFGISRIYYDQPNDCYVFFVAKNESLNSNAGAGDYRVVVDKIIAGINYFAIEKITGQQFSRFSVKGQLSSLGAFTRAVKVPGPANNMSATAISKSFKLGMKFQGGIVFYIDSTAVHGLVCSLGDLSKGSSWSDAISICKNYTAEGFNNWHLPTQDELTKLYKNRSYVGNLSADCTDSNFGNCSYWSSSENGNDFAWSLYFTNGRYWNNYGKTGIAQVRAVRTF